VHLRDVAGFAGAFLVNSIGFVDVASVDDTPLPDAAARVAGLRSAVAALPWDVV